jgi:5-methylcytosine-specific restriction endonuclease McrA
MDWKDKEQVREYHRNYWKKRRQLVLDFLGGECIQCGAKEGLEVDHVDPNLKSFDIKENVTLSNPDVLEELKKCQALCSDCHMEKTVREKASFTHGTTYGWMKAKCRCADCKAKMQSRDRSKY